jgi:hypothetical protein
LIPFYDKMATEHPEHPKHPECPEYPECDSPECESPESEHPESEHPEAEHPEAEHPEAEHPEAEYPEAEHPEAEYPEAEHPESDTTIGEDREEEVIEEAIVAVLARKKRENQLYHTGLRGRDYVRELLNCGNQRRCFEVLRMSLTTFQALVYWLVMNTELKSSRKQAGIQVEEKVMIFLYIISRGASNRDTAERFSHSNHSISR